MSDTGSIACGAEITRDTTLHDDLACAQGPALVVVADGVVLDLGGHAVSGDPIRGPGPERPGRAGDRGPGIVLRGVKDVTVRNGTVRHFDAGVVIEGGSGNVVEQLVVEDNIGSPDGDFGDGIVVNNSGGNRIQANTVRRNGPFSGIALGPLAQGNEVRDNIVADNDMAQLGDPVAGRQCTGIRIEGPAANHNRVEGNIVTGSGSDGIAVLATCDDPNTEPPCIGTPPNEHNEIAANTASGNGRSGQGCGVRLFSMADPVAPVRNTIRDNVADDNASYGIAIDDAGPGSAGNAAIGNRARGNREFDGSDGALMPPCGKNVWDANDFGSVNQPCVSRRAEEPTEIR